MARSGISIPNLSSNVTIKFTTSKELGNGEKTARELGIKLKNITFSAAYTSDMLRAEQTAKLILSTSENDDIKIKKDMRLREWCLGSMGTYETLNENSNILIVTHALSV